MWCKYKLHELNKVVQNHVFLGDTMRCEVDGEKAMH